MSKALIAFGYLKGKLNTVTEDLQGNIHMEYTLGDHVIKFRCDNKDGGIHTSVVYNNCGWTTLDPVFPPKD